MTIAERFKKVGIVTLFGLLGVPQNEIEATILLGEAATHGDRVAQRLLAGLRDYQAAMLRARTARDLSQEYFF